MKVHHEKLGDILLPDFLVVGAAKSATTSLYYYLGQHPEIQMTSIKENWFFSFLNNPPHYTSPGKLHDVVTSLDEYVKLFKGASQEQRLGDASPSYLYTYQDTIQNIRSVYPQEALDKLRIIISLREPVSRAFSQYYTFKRVVQEPLSFEEAVQDNTIRRRLNDNWNIFYDYTGFGRYYEQVKAFLDFFGNDRVLVVLYDDILNEAVEVCKSIYTFLGVDSSFTPDVETRLNAVSGEPKVKWLVRALISRNPIKRTLSFFIKIILLCLPKEIRNKILHTLLTRLFKRTEISESIKLELSRAYCDDIKRLEALIGRDLSQWGIDA